MRLIDLPPSFEGENCVLCAALGELTTARLLDRDGCPVCYPHFAQLLNFEAILRNHAREEEEARALECMTTMVPFSGERLNGDVCD